MVLESTMVCVDNSDFMRNGDFVPTRLQAQQDAVNLICHSKTRSNPENNVGLMTMTSTEVLVTLTSDIGRIFTKLHSVQPTGNIRFVSGIRVAHLALKHRQGKNHKMRIIAFIGSPVEEDEKELTRLAKRLKKEKVNIDVVNFGEDAVNTDKLTTFINTINGKDGTGSHLVTVSQGPMLSDALVTSPIVVGEDGSGAVPGGMQGFEFGVDPNEDPELALALRVSMEEQRARQEEDARKSGGVETATATPATIPEESNEEVLLKQALDMSLQPDDSTPTPASTTAANSSASSNAPDPFMMSEEDQIAYAMQLSMAPGIEDNPPADSDAETPSAVAAAAAPMETDEAEVKGAEGEEEDDEDEDMDEVMNDPEFLQSVLEGLPGVDPQSEAIQSAMGQLAQQKQEKKESKKKDGKK